MEKYFPLLFQNWDLSVLLFLCPLVLGHKTRRSGNCPFSLQHSSFYRSFRATISFLRLSPSEVSVTEILSAFLLFFPPFQGRIICFCTEYSRWVSGIGYAGDCFYLISQHFCIHMLPFLAVTGQSSLNSKTHIIFQDSHTKYKIHHGTQVVQIFFTKLLFIQCFSTELHSLFCKSSVQLNLNFWVWTFCTLFSFCTLAFLLFSPLSNALIHY